MSEFVYTTNDNNESSNLQASGRIFNITIHYTSLPLVPAIILIYYHHNQALCICMMEIKNRFFYKLHLFFLLMVVFVINFRARDAGLTTD